MGGGVTRYAITLTAPDSISRARAWLDRAAQLGWRVIFTEPKRSDAQNDRFWELLGRVSKRMDIGGRKFTSEQWKCIYMKAVGKEAEFLPTLDGASYFPTGFRSSDLSVREMADLQTFIEASCAERGVDIWANDQPS